MSLFGAALAHLHTCSWQEAEQRAQRLKASAVAQQALDAIAAGTSTVSAAPRDRLRAGLDTLCMDKGVDRTDGGMAGLPVARAQCRAVRDRIHCGWTCHPLPSGLPAAREHH
jgi:hypothetical protein